MKRIALSAVPVLLLWLAGQPLAGPQRAEEAPAADSCRGIVGAIECGVTRPMEEEGSSPDREAAAKQAWEESYARTDKFLVQQALEAGADSETAERMRAILADRRAFRRETLELLWQGKISQDEMYDRARASKPETDEKLKALLGPEIYAALDEDEARYQASREEADRPFPLSEIRGLTGGKLLEECRKPFYDDDDCPQYVCREYIWNVLDAYAALEATGQLSAPFCIPTRVMISRPPPMQFLEDAVVDYLTNTPAAREKRAFQAVSDAFAAAFPCR